MTILEFYEGLAAEKRQARPTSPCGIECTPDRLRYEFGGYELASRKKKGAGKGYKECHEWRWRDRAGYMAALRERFPREYAIRLCRDEREELLADRWWDFGEYRAEHVRAYRERIKAIRLEHGLSKSDVEEFMRV